VTSSFVLAALRATPRPWDKEANVTTIERLARQAADAGADVAVTPEGFVEGYVWQDDLPKDFSRERYLEIGETIDGPVFTRLAALAAELRLYLAVGFAERRGEHMYNSVAVLSPAGELASLYAKTHTAGDDEWFNTRGTDFPVFDTPFGRFGTLICMDRQLPETSRILAVKGAQVIMIPAWGTHGEMNDIMMRTRAFENGVHVCFVHPKRCLVIDPEGTVIAHDTGGTEEIVKARITVPTGRVESPINARRPEIYGDLGDDRRNN
jgi:predicted amidohydrolase